MHTSGAQFKFYYLQAGSLAIYISELPFATASPLPTSVRATPRLLPLPNIIITNESVKRRIGEETEARKKQAGTTKRSNVEGGPVD